MTGPTHKVYSILFAFLTAILLYHINISNINYYLILIIVLLVSKKGAVFPDLDHNWQSIGDKSVPNKIINTIIHITGGKHRSWQTHSIDICTIFTLSTYFVPCYLYSIGKITGINKEVIIILGLGFASGWISHLFSDMLTSGGVRLICFLKFKVKFVPRQIGKLKFNTGNEWEKFNYKTISILNKIVGCLSLTYPFIISYILEWRG